MPHIPMYTSPSETSIHRPFLTCQVTHSTISSPPRRSQLSDHPRSLTLSHMSKLLGVRHTKTTALLLIKTPPLKQALLCTHTVCSLAFVKPLALESISWITPHGFLHDVLPGPAGWVKVFSLLLAFCTHWPRLLGMSCITIVILHGEMPRSAGYCSPWLCTDPGLVYTRYLTL